MKGPGLRIENDVRRFWECPKCGRRDRSGGDATVVRCGDDGVPMRLIEGRRQVRQFASPVASQPVADDCEQPSSPNEEMDPGAAGGTPKVAAADESSPSMELSVTPAPSSLLPVSLKSGECPPVSATSSQDVPPGTGLT